MMNSISVLYATSLSRKLESSVISVGLSPDGKLLAVGGYHGRVFLCNLDNLWNFYELPYSFQEYGGVRNVVFNRSTSLLASNTSEEEGFNLWDIAQQAVYAPWNAQGKNYQLESVLFHRDERYLFGGGSEIICWDVHAGQEHTRLPVEQDIILDLAIDTSGRWLAGAGLNNQVHVWDLANKTAVHVHSPGTNRVNAVDFSPQGDILISGGGGRIGDIQEDLPNDSISLWQMPSLQLIRTLRSPSRWVQSIAHHPHLPIMATAACYGNITLWDTTTWTIQHVLESRCHYMDWVCFHPTRPWLLCAGAIETHRHYPIEIWQYE